MNKLDEQSSDKLLLRFPEAALLLGLGLTTIYELVNSGELPTVRIGRAVRIPKSALQEWINRSVSREASHAEASQQK